MSDHNQQRAQAIRSGRSHHVALCSVLFFGLLTEQASGQKTVELVSDLKPGGNSSDPFGMTFGEDQLFFFADPAGFPASFAVFETGGAAASTTLLADLDNPPLSPNYSEPTTVGDRLFFRGISNIGTDDFGSELYTSDGTISGTELVKDIYLGSSSSTPTDLLSDGNQLFFYARNGDPSQAAPNTELYRSDGTSAGTFMVKEIQSNGGIFSVDAQIIFASSAVSGGIYYFRANGDSVGGCDEDTIGGVELWRSDGTSAGTFLLADITPGCDVVTGVSSSNIFHLTDVAGTLVFSCEHPTAGRELCKSDGTAGGTGLAVDIYPGTTGIALNSSNPDQLVAVGNVLYFTADGGTSGRELWKWTEAGGASLVEDLTPGPGDSTLAEMTAYQNELLFAFDNGDTANGNELWRSDGTALGTFLVKDIATGVDAFDRANDANPTELTVSGDRVYFSAFSTEFDTELWGTDGTAGGTALVEDLNPGAFHGFNSSFPGGLEDADGVLYFAATRPDVQRELFRLVDGFPQVTGIDTIPTSGGGALLEGEAVTISISQLATTFDQPVVDRAGDTADDDVTNPANYLLVESGTNLTVQTSTCTIGPAGDDVAISIDSVSYDSATTTATVSVNGSSALAGGLYNLVVCGSTSIENSGNKKLDGNGDGTGGDDLIRAFTVRDSDGDGLLDGEDPSPCAGANLTLINATFQDGDVVVCTGTSSIGTQGSVRVGTGADLTLNSPQVSLGPGFSVEAGAVFSVETVP